MLPRGRPAAHLLIVLCCGSALFMPWGAGGSRSSISSSSARYLGVWLWLRCFFVLLIICGGVVGGVMVVVCGEWW